MLDMGVMYEAYLSLDLLLDLIRSKQWAAELDLGAIFARMVIAQNTKYKQDSRDHTFDFDLLAKFLRLVLDAQTKARDERCTLQKMIFSLILSKFAHLETMEQHLDSLLDLLEKFSEGGEEVLVQKILLKACALRNNDLVLQRLLKFKCNQEEACTEIIATFEPRGDLFAPQVRRDAFKEFQEALLSANQKPFLAVCLENDSYQSMEVMLNSVQIQNENLLARNIGPKNFSLLQLICKSNHLEVEIVRLFIEALVEHIQEAISTG
mmetsp:Transcript_8849/g.15008  ORF Transcript_8849/g.15008 Transcript_8849/m.15008 type:complete len:265 (+) Transcript_8849:1009-1803(+)